MLWVSFPFDQILCVSTFSGPLDSFVKDFLNQVFRCIVNRNWFWCWLYPVWEQGVIVLAVSLEEGYVEHRMYPHSFRQFQFVGCFGDDLCDVVWSNEPLL